MSGIEDIQMNEDPRCCGSGICIIDAAGRCWCGRQWDGLAMHQAPLEQTVVPVQAEVADSARGPSE
ncbi:MAG: hypothetical protein FJY40_08190 [Betaproteobacteria bacterium]|nr:hypothetical protein [Betaproteobacteria bacterium]